MESSVRTRIAPSPTGFPHIGTIYQAMFDYVFAKHNNGAFVIRIEDTDQRRFVHGSEEVVMEALSWFGLIADEGPAQGGAYGPYRQSERLELYGKYVNELIEKGFAYRCFCTQERLEEMREEQVKAGQPTMYDKTCLHLSDGDVQKLISQHTEHVVRMKVPENETLVIEDPLVGPVEFDSNLIDHQVILKSDGFPTYHLAVVVDDHLMNITHVFRGREWLPSAPKHLLLYRYFDWEMPVVVHLPLILNSESKGKLSKRHGHSSVEYYKKLGYLPEAILNYMSLIVWNHPEGKEIYSFEEFIRLFELKDVTSQGPKFDLAKLKWVNGQYIRNMDNDLLAERLVPYTSRSLEQICSVLPLVKERLEILSDFDQLTLFFFEDIHTVLDRDLEILKAEKNIEMGGDEYWKSLLVPKKRNSDEAKQKVHDVIAVLEFVANWQIEELERVLRGMLEGQDWKIGELFMLVRVAVTGRTATPPLFETMAALGKDTCLSRLREALKSLA